MPLLSDLPELFQNSNKTRVSQRRRCWLRSLKVAKQLVGRHPRTGYLTPPVEDTRLGADTIESIVEYIFGSVKDWLEDKTFMQAYCNLPFKTIVFQSY